MAKVFLPKPLLSLGLLLFVSGTALSSAQAADVVPGQEAQAAPAPAVTLPAPLIEWCTHLSKELMSVNYERCIARPWKVDATSPGGRPIPHLLWSPSPTVTGKPRQILVLGALHGDEISAVSLVFRWMDFLDRQPESSFLRRNQYLFYPLINPDGFYAKPRTRTNQAGVDINRNFETSNWEKDAVQYWKKRTGSDPRRFPGNKPGSELETQVVQKAVDSFKPELIVSVHAPYKVLDHDGHVSFPTERSPLPVRALGAFPGSLGTYSGLDRKTPVITPELPSATMLPDLKVVEALFLYIMKAETGPRPKPSEPDPSDLD